MIHKIPEMKDGQENPYNMKIGAQIWQHKDWELAAIGGIISSDRPTPQSFVVFGLENLALKPGDYVMVARDNSNNQRYFYRPGNNGVIQAFQIKEGCIGQVKSIYKGRVHLVNALKTEYGDIGYPKVGGAITKILGYNRTMVDEAKSDKIAKAKKIHGAKWAEKLDGGAWLDIE